MPIVSAELRWLTSGAAARWLADEELQRLDAMAVANRLRRTLSAERVRLVSQQFELRRRAKTKFAAAQGMFFTPLGLEQATDDAVARHKAKRFAAGKPVADLCTGVGGDLRALAARGPTLGVELDSAVAWLANANLHVLGHADSSVCVGDATRLELRSAFAWHIDPDRRPDGHKTSQVEFGRPSGDELVALLATNPNAAIKLSPAAAAPGTWEESGELEWVSRGGECRQQVAWLGALAGEPGRRRATLVDARGETLRTVVGDDTAAAPVAQQLGRYVYEPEAAVVAARLAGVLATEHSLEQVAPQVAYFTGDAAISDAALASFEVLAHLPCDRRRLRALCRERGVGRIEVKKRGVDLDPARLQAELSGSGELAAVLLVYRRGSGAQAILARRTGLPAGL
ncbi:MAG: hypothetical protein U0836_07770 [Pirellulales bacterium]